MKNIIKYFGLFVAVLLVVIVLADSAAASKVDLDPAKAAIADGRWQEAVDLLIAAEKSDSRNNELVRLLGDAYTGLNDWGNAKKWYERALKLKGGDKVARLALGRTLVKLGKSDEAISVLKKGLEKARKDPEKARFNGAIGEALISAGNCNDAQQYLLTANIQDESVIDYRRLLGDAYFECGVYSLANIEYKAVLKTDSANCLMYYRIGKGLFLERQFQQALVSFQEAFLCDTTYTPVYYDLALLYVLSARSQHGQKSVDYYKNALYYFERYRDVWPDSNKVLVAKNVSLAYYYLGNAEKAAEELARAIEVGVDDPELLFLLGRSLQYLAYDTLITRAEAEAKFTDAIQRFDEYEAALTDADTATAELYQRRAGCRYAITRIDSNLAADEGWLQQTLNDYYKAIELDSTDARSISTVATILNGKVLKRYEEAKPYFDRMTELFPDEATYWFNAALPRLNLKQESEALPFLQMAMEKDTTAAGRVRKAAEEIASPILLKSGNLAEARKMYKTQIGADPNNCEKRQWLAYTYYAPAVDAKTAGQDADAKFLAAIPYLERAYNCYKKNGASPRKMRDIMLWLATAHTMKGEPDWEKARPLIDAALKANPGDAEFKKLDEAEKDTQVMDYVPGTKTGDQ